MPHIIPFFSEDLDLEEGLARLAGEIRQETRQLAKLSDVELIEAGLSLREAADVREALEKVGL